MKRVAKTAMTHWHIVVNCRIAVASVVVFGDACRYTVYDVRYCIYTKRLRSFPANSLEVPTLNEIS
jgi:hypothetical protein